MPTTITVEGMYCEGCEQAVTEALEAVPGVTSATVDRTSGSATIDGDADASELVSAVDAAGYDASA